MLYATETGRSEQYAKQLVELLGHAFNAQIYCMSDYDISSIEHEALLIVIASTFGNGDPPENGEVKKHLIFLFCLVNLIYILLKIPRQFKGICARTLFAEVARKLRPQQHRMRQKVNKCDLFRLTLSTENWLSFAA